MIPESIKKLIEEHGEKVAHNDFEKTKLARKYNSEMKFYDEFYDEMIDEVSECYSL